MKEDRRMKLQKKKFNSNHLLAIFIVVCGLLAGISVFAGGVLTQEYLFHCFISDAGRH